MLLTGRDIKLRYPVVATIRQFRRVVPFALHGHRMDQNRPGGLCLCGAQNTQKLSHIVAINRPHISKAKLFEQRRITGCTSHQRLGALGTFAKRAGQVFGDFIGHLAKRGF